MTQTIAIIDYGSGNLASAGKAFQHVVDTLNLPMRVHITGRAEDIAAADRIVLPGQGAFGDCINGLKAVDGMVEALEHGVKKQGKPFFGICVGMQLLATRGLEHGAHDGLNWIPGEVVRMTPSDPALKIPHMGWNNVVQQNAHPVLRGVIEKSGQEAPHFYFVHSFVMQCDDRAHVLGASDYGGPINAMVGRDNIIGVQFHPEKSQQAGLDLISEFLQWKV